MRLDPSMSMLMGTHALGATAAARATCRSRGTSARKKPPPPAPHSLAPYAPAPMIAVNRSSMSELLTLSERPRLMYQLSERRRPSSGRILRSFAFQQAHAFADQCVEVGQVLIDRLAAGTFELRRDSRCGAPGNPRMHQHHVPAQGLQQLRRHLHWRDPDG